MHLCGNYSGQNKIFLKPATNHFHGSIAIFHGTKNCSWADDTISGRLSGTVYLFGVQESLIIMS